MGRPASQTFLRALRRSSHDRSLGPAAREPSDPVCAEAIELLACLASQPGTWRYETATVPGDWTIEARNYARLKLPDDMRPPGLEWREFYAEAEARLREVARG